MSREGPRKGAGSLDPEEARGPAGGREGGRRPAPLTAPALAFPGLRRNAREPKPRTRGVTEIRGPYYSAYGRRHLEDVLETMGWWVDSVKFAGGSFALMPRARVEELIRVCHAHHVEVSTGGFLESVLAGQGEEGVEAYLEECADLGFDIVEVSAGFVRLPAEDHLRLVERVRKAGLKAKPELGILFGAGGDTPPEQLAPGATQDPAGLIRLGRRMLDAGAHMLMIESEGITENLSPEVWRTDVVHRVAGELGLERVMFEAAEPRVLAWYVQQYGPEVNLFVDHSQVVQLEALRAGIWGTKDLWRRVVTYKG